MTTVSIVIPVHGRAALTERCLHLLASQSLGVDAEIIVVDDASTDETPQLLRVLVDGGMPLRVVSHDVNTGFAGACNDGAAVATGEHIVFLNNDTEPRHGWLRALVDEADAHPAAAAIGAKLLFPDGTVQHAGVVIGQDRNPHHVYAGLPGDHPAVNRSRPFQVVTAACMLVRRAVFEELGGFDVAYRNGHEDVDLCLRLGDAGHEVRYCHRSELVHLESATRARRSNEAAANGRRYRAEWAARVQPDDVGVYLADGLLRVVYDETHPLRLHVSPLLATVHDGARHRATERLLRTRADQVSDLLQRLVALRTGRIEPISPATDPDADDDVVDALDHLDRVLAVRAGTGVASTPTNVAYRRLVTRVRERVVAVTPPDAVVAVVSRGDDDLVELAGRIAWHFPQDDSGQWAGHHPADSDDAIAALESVLRRGATHLVVPSPSRWWLDEYGQFAERLRTTGTAVDEDDDCVVFALAGALRSR
jgi:GT2 family glycosyltransferase